MLSGRPVEFGRPLAIKTPLMLMRRSLLGNCLEQFRYLLLPELRHAGRAVAARFGGSRYQIGAGILDALERLFKDSGFRGITLVIGGVDGQHRGADVFQTRRGVIVSR